jgi:hypothetical protein
MALMAVSAGAVDDPWIITTDVVITEPVDVENVIVAGTGSLTVVDLPEPGLRVTGNLLAVGQASITVENSVIQFMGTYHGQFALAVAEEARARVVGCDYRVPNAVQHALVVAGDAELEVSDTDFGDVQLISIGDAHLEAVRLNGNFEVIVQNDSEMTLTDIPRDNGAGRVWVWVEFGEGTIAEYSPPMPGFVDSWTFPPVGSEGIAQRVTMDRCETLLWPMLVREGSRLTLRDIHEDNWVVVGLHLPGDVRFVDLVNNRTYEHAELVFDREIKIMNASVDTWNLYPQLDARVTVRDSVVGEILSMDSSRVLVENTTVDGTGGFFGARHDSLIRIYDSTVTCTVEATQNGTIEFHSSSIQPYPQDPTGAFTRFGAYDRGRLLVDQTPVATTPALGGDGVIAVTMLANLPPHPPADAYPLRGSIGLYSLDGGPELVSWRLESIPRSSGQAEPISGGTAGVEDGQIGVWPGAERGVDHLLRTVLVDSWGRRLVGRAWVLGDGPRIRRPSKRLEQ